VGCAASRPAPPSALASSHTHAHPHMGQPSSRGHLTSPTAGPHGVIPLFRSLFPLPRRDRKQRRRKGGKQSHATREGRFPLLPAAVMRAKPRAPLHKRATPLLTRTPLFSPRTVHTWSPWPAERYPLNPNLWCIAALHVPLFTTPPSARRSRAQL
jgi:hypothetical protein